MILYINYPSKKDKNKKRNIICFTVCPPLRSTSTGCAGTHMPLSGLQTCCSCWRPRCRRRTTPASSATTSTSLAGMSLRWGQEPQSQVPPTVPRAYRLPLGYWNVLCTVFKNSRWVRVIQHIHSDSVSPFVQTVDIRFKVGICGMGQS